MAWQITYMYMYMLQEYYSLGGPESFSAKLAELVINHTIHYNMVY